MTNLLVGILAMAALAHALWNWHSTNKFIKNTKQALEIVQNPVAHQIYIRFKFVEHELPEEAGQYKMLKEGDVETTVAHIKKCQYLGWMAVLRMESEPSGVSVDAMLKNGYLFSGPCGPPITKTNRRGAVEAAKRL